MNDARRSVAPARAKRALQGGGAVGAITLRAPAKINLTLEVIERLPNGYHAIRSVMARLPRLFDVVRVRVADGSRIRVRADSPEVPGDETNICHRAARRYLDDVRESAHIDVEIRKAIPVAAGLGGGSSDAAAVLLALNRCFGDALSPRRLSSLAADLGKDVPFFLADAAIGIATGMGERVRRVPVSPRLHALLVNPRLAIPTKDAYAALASGLWFMSRREREDRSRTMARALASGQADAVAAGLYNDFETVIEPMYPVLKEIKQALLALGARGALMSGSGSTVFGLFASTHALLVAERTLKAHYPAFVVERG